MNRIQIILILLLVFISVIMWIVYVQKPTEGCQGQADCLRGKVTHIVDGDTLDINNIRVRLALVNTPELGEDGYSEAKQLVESVCSIGTEALVDEDDGQKEGSYDRLIGIVYCDDGENNKVLLNEVLLQNGHAEVFEDFCSESEFSAADWVQKYGC
jgi:micrococcal nuclease